MEMHVVGLLAATIRRDLNFHAALFTAVDFAFFGRFESNIGLHEQLLSRGNEAAP